MLDLDEALALPSLSDYTPFSPSLYLPPRVDEILGTNLVVLVDAVGFEDGCLTFTNMLAGWRCFGVVTVRLWSIKAEYEVF